MTHIASIGWRRQRGATALLAAAALGVSIAFASVGAPVTSASAAEVSYTDLVLQVGANESQRNVSWYSSADTAQVVQVAPKSTVQGGEFPSSAKTFSATGTANDTDESKGTFNRNATISNLAENTEYSYRIGAEGNWSPVYTFKTQSFEGAYDFLFFGDPQIGSSGNEVEDGKGWKATLDYALGQNPKAELLVSGGDQVETANTESEWSQYTAPDQLRQYPTAPTIGNHDVGGRAYNQHFHTPNTNNGSEFYKGGDNQADASGGNYWYIYKDVLFIDLNSNSYEAKGGSGGDKAHTDYVKRVVDQHGDDAKYTVLVYHHAIYSPASHAQDEDNKVRRVDFPTTFSKLGVDLVLQGHDHSYSRSYEIKNGEKVDADEQAGKDEVSVGPGGVIYVTANSASGSKYYDITKPAADEPTSGAGNGPDAKDPNKYWYNSVQNQEHVRTFVKVQVKKDALRVQNIRSGDCKAPNAAVTEGNVEWCGTEGAATPVGEVGSIVDDVTIRPNHGDGQDVQVDVPKATGEFSWKIDGENSLVDLGTAKEQNGDSFDAVGAINPIKVTDTRPEKSPWAVSVEASDFKDADKTLEAKYLGWDPRIEQKGAGATAGKRVSPAPGSNTGLAESQTLAQAAAGHERGTATLGAKLHLNAPATVEAGTYRSTLTITALSE